MEGLHKVIGRLSWHLLAAVVALAVVEVSYSEPPPTPAPSKYAPAADLLQQIDFFLGRTEESLATPADFDEAKQSRALKDGNTLAALALVLANHDQSFPEKPAMADLIGAAQQLAAGHNDYEQSKAALTKLKAARAGQATGQPAAEWQKVAALNVLMKQVPLIHTGLKRGVEPSRLARQKAQSAGQSASLAAIAQASLLDTDWVKSPEEAAQWRQFCIEMRDAAGEVNAGVHAQDSPRVAAGMKALSKSCDDCHARFRHE